jgi:ribonuclease D
MRRTLWSPPEIRSPGELLDAVVDQLTGYGARGWQIGLAAPVIVQAILDADVHAAAVAAEAATAPEPLDDVDHEDDDA